MNHRVQDFLDKVLALAPIPPEAYPGGIVGRSPAVKSLTELAWQDMAIAMFAAGTIFGMLLALIVALAVVFKSSVPAIMKAVANVPH